MLAQFLTKATRRSFSNTPFVGAAGPLDNVTSIIGEQLENGVAIHGDWRKAYGTGRRKTAVARVWLRPGDGEVSINKKDLVTYFDRSRDRESVIEPFEVTQNLGKWDARCIVHGGGKTGQAEALRQGIALALRAAHPLRYTKILRHHGLTTRDPRMVERKKPGQPKARKKFQWVKR